MDELRRRLRSFFGAGPSSSDDAGMLPGDDDPAATQRFLLSIVETLPVAVYATDLEGRITLWNTAAGQIFGYGREETVGRRAPFVPEGRREEAAAYRERVKAGEVLTHLELERRRKDGAIVHIHGSAAPLRDEDGRITGLLVMCVDATEIKRAGEALKQQLHFTRAVLDAIPNPVYVKDREGRYQVYNRAFDEHFGGGRDWVGRTVHEMFSPSLAEFHDERDRALYREAASLRYEAVVPTAQGEEREWLYNKVSFVDQSGNVAGLIGTITDVTHYKKTERALEASEARFRVLAENGIDLISVVAPTAR
ncbi:MAG: PAS domain-containing protein [Betaproteobacteria bacterium]|nr:PAS domain-containing protein [Betaproteobacteria bacterium]